MEFNWFTFAAQIINFLILVFLLKHFLFNRILSRMDERSRKIQEQLETAEKQQAEVEAQKQKLVAEQTQLAQKKDRLLAEAMQDVEARKQKLLDAARQEINRQHDLWLQSLQQEQDALLSSFETETRQYVLKISSKALTSLADSELQAEVLRRFVVYYGQLPDAQKNTLRQAVESTGELQVLTGLALDSSSQQMIREVLAFSGEQIRFLVQPELLAGVRLKTDGYKLDWNIHAYLQALEDKFLKTLRQHRQERKRSAEAKQANMSPHGEVSHVSG